MKEIVQKPGKRRWHGEEYILLQKEPLEAAQTFMGNFGAFVLRDCPVVLYGAGPNVTVGGGVVCLKHATDGFKICRFSGVSNVALPGYIKVQKTTITKIYDNLTVQDAAYWYDAVWVAGTPPASPGEYLIVTSVDTKLPVFADILASQNLTAWEQVWNSASGALQGSISMRISKSTRQIQVKGQITLTTGGSGIAYNTLLSTVPDKYKPLVAQNFKAEANPYKNANSGASQWIVDQGLVLNTNGDLAMHVMWPITAPHIVYINATLLLD